MFMGGGGQSRSCSGWGDNNGSGFRCCWRYAFNQRINWSHCYDYQAACSAPPLSPNVSSDHILKWRDTELTRTADFGDDTWWVTLLTCCAKLYALYGAALGFITSLWLALRLILQGSRSMARGSLTMLGSTITATLAWWNGVTPMQRACGIMAILFVFASGAARHRASCQCLSVKPKRRRRQRCKSKRRPAAYQGRSGTTHKRRGNHRDQSGGADGSFLLVRHSWQPSYMSKPEVNRRLLDGDGVHTAIPSRKRSQWLFVLLILMVAALVAIVHCTHSSTRADRRGQHHPPRPLCSGQDRRGKETWTRVL